MKKTFVSLIACAVVATISVSAFADDMSKHDQMMKNCMAKQDKSMPTDEAMKKCSDKMHNSKMSKDAMQKPSTAPAPAQK